MEGKTEKKGEREKMLQPSFFCEFFSVFRSDVDELLSLIYDFRLP